MLPAPVKVRFWLVPVMALPEATSKVKVPAVLPMVVEPVTVIAPVMVLLSELFKIAPALPTPTPLALIVLAIEMLLESAKVAPDAIVTAEVPKAELFEIANVPALIVVAPV